MWWQSLRTRNQKPTSVVQLLKAQLTAHLKCLSLMAKEDDAQICWPPSQLHEEVRHGHSESLSLAGFSTDD